MKRLLLAFLFAAALHAQPAPSVIWLNITSSQVGASCPGTQYMGYVYSSLQIYTCSGSPRVWTIYTAGSAGGISIGATVTGGDAQDVLYVTSAGKLGQDDNFQWLHAAATTGQIGVAIGGTEPDLSCCDGPGNSISFMGTSGQIISNLIEAAPSADLQGGSGHSVYISQGTPTVPTDLPTTGNQFVLEYDDVIAHCNSIYEYMASLAVIFNPAISAGGIQYNATNCIDSGNSELFLGFDASRNATATYFVADPAGNTVAIQQAGIAPSTTMGIYQVQIYNDGSAVGNMTYTGSGANTTLEITSASGTATYLGTNAQFSGLAAGGFVKAAPTTGLLSVVSSAGGGVPLCVSNTASASSTAYSCSDGGSSTIAAGYVTIWQPGTNDTANTTGVPTLAVDGAAAATIVNVGPSYTQALGVGTVGKIFTGVQFVVVWNGTNWQIDQSKNTIYANSNTAAGYEALYQTGTGTTNSTCLGSKACATTTSLGNETAVGYNALNADTNTGGQNVAVGSGALAAQTSGGANVGVGYNVLNAENVSNTVAIGWEAGTNALGGNGGSNDVFVGYQASTGSNAQSNCIAIGYNTLCEGSNTANIGNSSVTAGYLGGVPMELQQATGTLAITASATALTCTTGTATATGATTGMVVVVSAAGTADLKTTAPQGYVSSAGNITINVCTLITDSSPPSITYNWRVLQ
jgi:hypothetical protein